MLPNTIWNLRDIHDSMPGNQEYPFGQPYPIEFTKVYTYGF